MAWPKSTDDLHNSWGGMWGVDVLSSPSGTTGQWSKLVAKGAVTSVTLVSNWSASPSALADGEVIYGKFTAVTGNGVIYAYKGAP